MRGTTQIQTPGRARAAIITIGIMAPCLLLSSTALSQTPCDEPQEQAYLERMDQVSVAVEIGDFEAVLTISTTLPL